MKKIAFVLALAMLLGVFGACGRKTVDTTTTESKTTTTANITTTTANTKTTTASGSEEGTTTTTTANNEGGSETTTRTQYSSVTSTDLHEPVEPTMFDDAVIIGDSVTLKLSYYVSNQKNKGEYPLGQAKFLCSGSLGYTNALWSLNHKDNVHPRYNGVKYRIPEGVAATGAKKAFIMLGMNDFMLYGFDGTIESAEKLIGEIVQNSPDIKIYVQSVTPILASCEGGSKTNANVRKLNTMLRAMCDEHGWTYLDVAGVMVDSYGALKPAYCGDPETMGIHFTDAACQAWVDYLKKNI
ncbi:MAG: hypothetical protein IKY44_04070 [Clostridia bacterium]|nr:hypothetical protein [Clostridia bacterium]